MGNSPSECTEYGVYNIDNKSQSQSEYREEHGVADIIFGHKEIPGRFARGFSSPNPNSPLNTSDLPLSSMRWFSKWDIPILHSDILIF